MMLWERWKLDADAGVSFTKLENELSTVTFPKAAPKQLPQRIPIQ